MPERRGPPSISCSRAPTDSADSVLSRCAALSIVSITAARTIGRTAMNRAYRLCTSPSSESTSLALSCASMPPSRSTWASRLVELVLMEPR